MRKEELATISSDRSLKIKHSAVDIDTFWISIQKEFPALAEKALLVLLQFSTSYLCELGFSTLNNIKNMKRGRLRSTEEERESAYRTYDQAFKKSYDNTRHKFHTR